MSQIDQYTDMQKRFYDLGQASEEEIVGNYDYHENFPYETNILHVNGDIRKPVLRDFSSAVALDVGCGEGRMVRRMSKFLGRVDGADISEKMINAARERSPKTSNFYVTAGANCGDAQSNTYDLVYNTISLHHICVYDVRAGIIKDITRILKPDGRATLQFFFSKYYPYCRTVPPLRSHAHLMDLHHRDALQADWFENRWDAKGTNSQCDAAFGTSHIPAVLNDFKKWFRNVSVWLVDISVGRPDPRDGGAERVLAETHPNCHGIDFAWFTHMAFFYLSDPIKTN